MPRPHRHRPRGDRGGAPRLAWRGDVEPIPFPFRSGLLGPFGEAHDEVSRLVDFDESGGWIVIAVRHGMLFACQVDGTDAEILPRPLVEGEVMSPGTGVIGVAGGFVAGGQPAGSVPMLAHYDFTTRTCIVHVLPSFARGVARSPGPITPISTAWRGVPPIGDGRAWRSISRPSARPPAGPRGRRRPPNEPAPGFPPTRRRATSRRRTPRSPGSIGPAVTSELDPNTGTLRYRPGCGEPRSLTPMSDGHPALKGTRIASFRQGGDVLAVQILARSVLDLCFIAISRSAVIGRFSTSSIRRPGAGSRSLATGADSCGGSARTASRSATCPAIGRPS